VDGNSARKFEKLYLPVPTSLRPNDRGGQESNLLDLLKVSL
jgi:hypothetical protein